MYPGPEGRVSWEKSRHDREHRDSFEVRAWGGWVRCVTSQEKALNMAEGRVCWEQCRHDREHRDSYIRPAVHHISPDHMRVWTIHTQITLTS